MDGLQVAASSFFERGDRQPREGIFEAEHLALGKVLFVTWELLDKFRDATV
jgi:hypothetical protein